MKERKYEGRKESFVKEMNSAHIFLKTRLTLYD